MKAIANVHGNWTKDGYEFPSLGKEIKHFDESEAYETDEARLFKLGTKYTILSATGCSCWDGDWEGWTDLTKPELYKIAKSWANPNSYDHAEKNLGAWIIENKSEL